MVASRTVPVTHQRTVARAPLRTTNRTEPRPTYTILPTARGRCCEHRRQYPASATVHGCPPDTAADTTVSRRSEIVLSSCVPDSVPSIRSEGTGRCPRTTSSAYGPHGGFRAIYCRIRSQTDSTRERHQCRRSRAQFERMASDRRCASWTSTTAASGALRSTLSMPRFAPPFRVVSLAAVGGDVSGGDDESPPPLARAVLVQFEGRSRGHVTTSVGVPHYWFAPVMPLGRIDVQGGIRRVSGSRQRGVIRY